MPEWDNNSNWGNRGRRDNDWNRGGGWDNDWDRNRRGRNGGWDNDWWGNNNWWGDNDWDKRFKKHKKRRYNHYYNPYGGAGAWWYPYWNQYLAPVVNPIMSWFAPYPTSLPVVAQPGVYW